MDGIVANEVQSLVDFVKGEARYLCCFTSYVATFNQKKEELKAKLRDVDGQIENARGAFRVKEEARHWTDVARSLIDFDTRKEKCFNDLFPNCWRQYQKGKDLKEKTQQIDELLEKCSSDIVVGPADVAGIKYHSLQNFMHFESRKSSFQHLKKALEDENCNMVGLHGFGGTGKTSMAIQVGVELEGSKFDKVIFLVVSQPPNFKKIRHELAKHLDDLPLDEGKEDEHSKKIWSKITNMKKKLLIILDDVWEELDLKQDLGIPSSHQHKACSVLITTRKLLVCESMRCQVKIQMKTLIDKDALNLFLAHASIDDSSLGLRGVAEKIVKNYCGGVPIIIVAIANTLKKDKREIVWQHALQTLEDRGVDDPNLESAYNCLKLSYDNLKVEKAQELFLISSLAPKDFVMRNQTLSKIAIGLGLFGEVDKYHSVRGKVVKAIQELIDSFLLLAANEECVKMHDLVRDVALWIGGKDIQWIMNLETPIMENLRYLVWKNNCFPDVFDGKNLEILMIFLDGLPDLKVPNTFFEEMTRLKVLHLASDDDRISAPTLLYSLQSLKDIRTLSLLNLKLDDISLLGNLSRLESLWLFHCSIMKLPKEFLKLKKLRLLEVEECKIERNNPFEVIERCSQLEELSFVENEFDNKKAYVVSENLSPPKLQRYKISQFDLESISEKYGFISRWFCLEDLRNLISEATFKKFVRTTEVLMLREYKESRWKNLIPDIVAVEDGGMNNLIVLHLSSWPDIQCLIDGKKHETNVTAFSKLVELKLFEMDVEDLYQGSLPFGFLEQLQIMKLRKCHKLRNILSDGKLGLGHLKVMKLNDCPKWTSIFQSFTAQSLMQLEELRIKNCDSLEHIITCKRSGGEIMVDDDDKSYELLLPRLKTLEIKGCEKLQIVLPVLFGGALASLEEITICECKQLIYIFDKFQKEDHIMLPLLQKMELCQVPSFISIFREYHKTVPLSTQQGSLASKKWFDNSEIIRRQLFNVGHIKKLKLTQMPLNSVSLFTLSIASSILWEELIIQDCDGLKQLITMEADYNDQKMSCHSIFPKLENLEMLGCEDLEFLFPSTISIELASLEEIKICECKQVRYIFDKFQKRDHVMLPSLKIMELYEVSSFISIFREYYKPMSLLMQRPSPTVSRTKTTAFSWAQMCCFWDKSSGETNGVCKDGVPDHTIQQINPLNLVWPSLQCVTLENRKIESFNDDLVVCFGQLDWKTIEELDAYVNVQATRCLLIQSLNNVKEMTLLNFSNSKTLLTLPMASMILWENLTIRSCKQLKYIVADEEDVGALMNNHGSIFPKLKALDILECDALEYLFPAYFFRSTTHLKSLSIWQARELKYVFGTSHHENQNIQTYIDFPSLEMLAFAVLPKLVSICPKNYYLRGLSLKSFNLWKTPEFNIRSLTDFMICALGGQRDSTLAEAMKMRLQSLDYVRLEESKIEEIFNLAHMDTQKNEGGHELLTSTLEQLTLESLSELKSICVGPKHILSLNNISDLEIKGCNKLKVIFSYSILKSLPNLWWLQISKCEELTHIIEENAHDDHLQHEPCFPILYRLIVEGCNKLEYLFSIKVSGILPKLGSLDIEESFNLEHVLIRQDETKEMNVLPKIRHLGLSKLSNLKLQLL